MRYCHTTALCECRHHEPSYSLLLSGKKLDFNKSLRFLGFCRFLGFDVRKPPNTNKSDTKAHENFPYTIFICVLPIVFRRIKIINTTHSLYAIARPSVVCNARAPYSGSSNFRQYFYGIRYLGHPLTSTENFTEVVPGEPFHRGS